MEYGLIWIMTMIERFVESCFAIYFVLSLEQKDVARWEVWGGKHCQNLFCWYCHPERTKTCWIAIAMIIPCSQHDDGAQKSHHVTEFVWSAWNLWPNQLITTHRSSPPNHWWEINSLTGFLSCNLLFSNFSSQKRHLNLPSDSMAKASL